MFQPQILFMLRSSRLFGLISLAFCSMLLAEPHALISKFDEDKDGYLGGEEIPTMLLERMDRMDIDEDGKLSGEELNKVPDRAVKRMVAGETMPSRAPRKPGEVVAPAAKEEFDKQKLKIGDEVPDFTLQTYDQKSEITLSSFRGEKPVVLVFGSITCSPFRQRVLEVVPLFEQYQEKAQFLMVYIREAHPESAIQVPTPGGGLELRKFEQTDELVSRQESVSPRPRLRAPVRPYFVRVRARARLERVRACVCVLLGGVCRWCAGGVACWVAAG